MSKHNYSQYSNKKNNDGKTDREAKLEVKPAPVKMVVEPVETAAVAKVESVETNPAPAIVKGIVTGCSRLNVRAYPSLDADVVCVLDVMSELEINDDKSTYDWLCICTATGIEGYCMKKFIETDL